MSSPLSMGWIIRWKNSNMDQMQNSQHQIHLFPKNSRTKTAPWVMKQVASKNKNPKDLPVSWDRTMKHSLITRSLIPSTNRQHQVAYPNLRALEDFTTEIEESKRSERNKFTLTTTRKGQTALIKCFRCLSIIISSKWKRNTWEWNLATSGSITRLKLSKNYRNPSKNKVSIFSPTFPQIDHKNKANGPNFPTIKSQNLTKHKRK